MNELASSHNHDRRTIRKWFESYELPKKIHRPRPIYLIVDAIYFGERANLTSWCVLVFKDELTKEDLWWLFADTETTIAYYTGRKVLEDLGYTILSVTGDGFRGIRSAFSGLPFQMCQVHMERLVIQRITRRPKLEAGIVLLALIRTVHTTNRSVFIKRFNLYIEKYRGFLNEKSINLETGEKSWTHEELRRAAQSMQRFLPYLFTYEENPNIPKTTNALEGHFSHLRDILRVHRGISRKQKERIIETILLNSSIAPKKKTKRIR